MTTVFIAMFEWIQCELFFIYIHILNNYVLGCFSLLS